MEQMVESNEVTESVGRLLSSTQVAEVLSVHRSTVARWRSEGRLRPVGLVGNSPVYTRSQVEALQRQLESGNKAA